MLRPASLFVLAALVFGLSVAPGADARGLDPTVGPRCLVPCAIVVAACDGPATVVVIVGSGGLACSGGDEQCSGGAVALILIVGDENSACQASQRTCTSSLIVINVAVGNGNASCRSGGSACNAGLAVVNVAAGNDVEQCVSRVHT